MRKAGPLWLITSALLGLAGLRAAAAPPTAPDTMEQRLLACAICHGEQGEGLRKNEYFPRLAGKPRDYLFNQLINFRERRREFPIMNYLVGFMSDNYLLEIADHYAKLRPPFPAASTRAKPAELALGGRLVNQGDPSRKLPACTACHGKALTGMEPAIPGLLGLYPPYIASQLGAWKDGKRHAMAPDCMHEVSKLLTPTDIGAITAWLVAQPVPADAHPAPAGAERLPLECGGLKRK